MKYLSQRNPAWAANFLGASKLTVGRFGCTTTCISMLSDFFDCYMSPAEIAADKKRYTKAGLVLWEFMTFKNMAFKVRTYGRDDKAIQAALKDPNMGVALQVNNGAHWILALRKTIIGNDYVCLDPWDGAKCNAIGKYHNITGAAYFVRK